MWRLKGWIFFIESGTLHAIGKGILLAEIQQNSNTTYRVYDYNRLGADGKPRELHTEKALDVTKCEPPKNNGVMPPVVKKDGYDEKHLTSCELFSVKDITVNKSYSSVADSNSFVSILVIDGNGSLICENETFPLCKGDSYFISADSGEFKICGNVNLIETRVWLLNWHIDNISVPSYNVNAKYCCLRGGVKFPTGGKSPQASADRVQLPNRRYSPDERRCT